MENSRFEKFYERPLSGRLEILKEQCALSDEDISMLKKFSALDEPAANRMIENVIGTTQIPLGIATNFRINGKDYVVPMAIEESSVVAAASKAAKLARDSGGFEAKASEPIMIGQIVLANVNDLKAAGKRIIENKDELLDIANSRDSVLLKFGGGAKDIEVHNVKTSQGEMLSLHLLVDVRDAMGANAVNTMCEAISGRVIELTGGEPRLKIISNLAIHRTVKAKAVWKKELLPEGAVDKVVEANAFAQADIFRASTHNKGIMNGIDAVCLATGNDWRAVEAGAHSFAAIKGNYSALTKYSKDKDGNLAGEIELPLAVGTVGGATRIHPIAQISLKILGVKGAAELSCVIASVGLAQNFAALLAITTHGIQAGHMKLHAKNLAAQAGAKGNDIDRIAEKMISEKNISASRAKDILEGK